MEIKKRIPNSEYSITTDGLIVDDKLRLVKPYQIDGINKRDFYDLEINGVVTRFSHRSIIKRVTSVKWYDELWSKARAVRREAAAEYERLRQEHRAAVRALPMESEYELSV